MSLDLEFTEDEELLRKTALDFLRKDAPKDVVQRLQETGTGITDDLWRKAVEMGWLGIIIPQQYDGTGFPLTSAGVLFEALGTGPLPGPYFTSGILASLIIMETGSEEQKQQILPGLAKGDELLSLALTEPAFSWNPANVETSAVSRKGDFVLNGVKLFATDAEAATRFIVVARTDKEPGDADGLSLFLVDRLADGVSVSQQTGFLAGRNSEVRLDNVEVGQSAMLGVKDQAYGPLELAIEKATPVLCAYKAGGCQAVIDMTLEYSRIREQFGQPIGRFQRVQDMIIDMVTHSDAARWATYEALWKLDTQERDSESIHLAKALASQSYSDVCTLAHQVFSGIGYSRESPLSFHTRASRSLYHFLGEPSYHRQKIAGLLADSWSLAL